MDSTVSACLILRVRDFQLDSPVFTWDFASGCRGVQSFGGKATCQNIGLGSVNSTPACGCSLLRRSIWATTHSSAALVWMFDRVSRCPRYTGVETRSKAP